MTVEVRRLAPHDDRTRFRSGNVELDRFFLRYAGQNQFRHHIGTTYVAVREDGFIAGFATVTASEVATAVLSASKRKRLPHSTLCLSCGWRGSPSTRGPRGRASEACSCARCWSARSGWPGTLAAWAW